MGPTLQSLGVGAWELGLDLKSSDLHLDLAAVAAGQGSGMRIEWGLSWLFFLLL